jgi:allophanate hydrolase
MSVTAFAALLERLVFTPARNAKLALLRDWFATQPDPDRGIGLAALTGTLEFTAAKPGLIRVAKGSGARIALELWDMPLKHYGSFVALIPAPLGIGTLNLLDGSQVQGFLCEYEATRGALNISHLGGWRAYIASLVPR